jgi:hypothetical protein
MWDKLLKRNKKSTYVREYNYASHHHLIPLYILSGITILTLLVMGCFVTVLWQTSQREAFRPLAAMSVDTIENLYLSAVVVPAEKKQYVYSANVRFPVSDAYDTFRYSYDPGVAKSRTSSTITLTTTKMLHDYESLIINNPQKATAYLPKLQECSRLYVIRFEPGLVPFGGFSSIGEAKLKDGRVAYIHKNVNCVPSSTEAMTVADGLEQNLRAIESY